MNPVFSEKVAKAIEFAERKHAGQIRRYTGEPYVEHVKRVAMMVAAHGANTETICAALLHDTVEDTDTTRAEIEAVFGATVALYVEALTDVRPVGVSRATHKAKRAKELSWAAPEVQNIKYADFIDNAKSIIEHDPKFAKVFMAEMREAVLAMKDGDRVLRDKAWQVVREYEENILQGSLKKGDTR